MPEPILVAIAAALAGKSVGNLYDLVRRKFAARKDSTEALEAAKGAAPDSPEVHTLTEHLAQATATDPDFATALHSMWTNTGTINQISGNVSGNVVQARDIKGNITFGA